MADLANTIDALKNYIKETGRDSSPEWISLNLKLQSSLLKARPFVADHVWRQLS